MPYACRISLFANFDLCPITDELSGGSPCPDLVLQCADELPICLDGINSSHQRLHANKTLGGDPRVYSWCVGIDDVSSNWFIPPMDIKGRKRGFVLIFEKC